MPHTGETLLKRGEEPRNPPGDGGEVSLEPAAPVARRVFGSCARRVRGGIFTGTRRTRRPVGTAAPVARAGTARPLAVVVHAGPERPGTDRNGPSPAQWPMSTGAAPAPSPTIPAPAKSSRQHRLWYLMLWPSQQHSDWTSTVQIKMKHQASMKNHRLYY